MPLDPLKLEKVKPIAGGFIARCPVCALDGGDHAGQHLRSWSEGHFACAANPGDKDHRRAIYALAGDRARQGPLPVAPRTVFKRRMLDHRLAEEMPRHFAAIRTRLWTPAEIRNASPAAIPEDPTEQALCLVRLFRPLDTVWIGDHFDSGKPHHIAHFRTAREWLKGGVIAGPRICPAAFIPGTFVRARRTVRRWRFLVVESDQLAKAEQGAVLRWLANCGFKLRAVVDTAGRSLHGWLDLPPKRELDRLTVFFRAYQTDLAVVNPAQPCRLPGWPRADTGALPTLIYFDP